MNNKYFSSLNEMKKVARLSIYSNTTLFIIKLAIGIFMGSVSVISEALHSGIDLLASCIANYSLHKACVPADDVHEFGHGKFENISGTIEALLIFIAAIIILKEAIWKILYGGEVELINTGLIIMGISAVTNFVISKKIMNMARRTESIALEANAYHLSTDVYTSLGVFIGLILIKITNNSIFDPILAIIVGLIIIKTSYDLTKKSLQGLMDTRLSEKEENTIKSIISDHTSNTCYHELRTRMSGAERFVDLHLVVPKDKSVSEAHDFCDHLEKEIKEMIPNLSILIHIEPCNSDCEICRSNICDHKIFNLGDNNRLNRLGENNEMYRMRK